MIVAGIGCRRGCPAADIVALVHGTGAGMLAAPEWKRGEAGLLEAARVLGLEVRFVSVAELSAVQDRCVTRSEVVARAVGLHSVAEAAALVVGGGLFRRRASLGGATCALGGGWPDGAVA